MAVSVGTKKINRDAFYKRVRVSVFNGRLSQSQVNGMEAIFNEWDKRGLTDTRWLAYILGTVFHESGHTMQPIEEYGKGKGYKYGRKVKRDGTPYALPDKIYYGRGHTQNTWWDNYNMLTKENSKGWDFLNHPELLLQEAPSIWATFHCMINGLYTGKKLSEYFNAVKEDWLNARRIINGTDRAELIEGYGRTFYAALL